MCCSCCSTCCCATCFTGTLIARCAARKRATPTITTFHTTRSTWRRCSTCSLVGQKGRTVSTRGHPLCGNASCLVLPSCLVPCAAVVASCHWVALDLPSESLCYCPACRPRACCILKAWHWNAVGCDMCGGYLLQGGLRFVAHMAAHGSACTCQWSSMPPNMMQPPSALHSFIYTFPSAIKQNKTLVSQALLCNMNAFGQEQDTSSSPLVVPTHV